MKDYAYSKKITVSSEQAVVLSMSYYNNANFLYKKNKIFTNETFFEFLLKKFLNSASSCISETY